ncbi:MAG: hypothetical protein AAF368_02660, partial [Planctomycetota bacterium]
WTRVIERARAGFRGRVGYRADWPGEAHRIEFWDQLDFCSFGIDEAFHHPQSPYRRPHDGIISGKFGRWLEAMRLFADERDLPLSVMAYLPASSMAWNDPRTPEGGEVDAYEQERLASALVWALRGLVERDLAPESIAFFGARTDPYAGGGDDRGFTLQNKPALDVLRAFAEASALEKSTSGD